MSAAILAFICSVCRTALEPQDCAFCAHNARAEQHAYDCAQHAQEQSEKAIEDSARRAIPGVADLEDMFDAEVVFSEDGDEETGCSTGLVFAHIAIKHGPCAGEWQAGPKETPESAVGALRHQIAKGLREAATDLEGGAS